ncbi:hypothetical protein B5X24_HaOG210166 [Helicoverpa armigera]|uniref:C2H2-type domain-containing protein n=1 Tax=Helicoverpa armigera TaxID=29058 RepID=A0A2W1BIH3_HELAM|nr:hypothetical protein B5X24_HaOG210166 [Helicoverpa armigera]
MSVAPAVKRELELESGGSSPGRKRRKQAAPSRATPQHPAPPPLDLHAKMADIYKSALAFGELGLPAFDPLAAFRLLPRHEPPRIFNPEAYCDLCCKEFCNKYFLKTHRANKHGIYDGGEPQPAPPPPAQPSPPRRASDEESGGTPRRLSPDSARRARESGFQPDALRRLGVVNPEAFCEICCKEYCNKYFLRTHRERRHGVPARRSPVNEHSPPSATPPTGPLCTPLGTPLGTPLPTPLTTPPALSGPPPDTPPRSHSLPPPLDPEEMAEVKRECEDELEAALRDGQTSPLNLIVEERGVSSPGSASEELRKLQTMISQLNELAAERLADEPNDPGPRPPSASPPPPDERRASSSGSSFCEICNKELCNKYFMRTHMQRMHGISLESGTQLGGVTCDICHKELCSKYFLRVHKHNTHGIPAPPAPAATHVSHYLNTYTHPFVVEEAGGALSLVPALVFLPVRRRATRRATVTLTLTPA